MKKNRVLTLITFAGIVVFASPPAFPWSTADHCEDPTDGVEQDWFDSSEWNPSTTSYKGSQGIEAVDGQAGTDPFVMRLNSRELYDPCEYFGAWLYDDASLSKDTEGGNFGPGHVANGRIAAVGCTQDPRSEGGNFMYIYIGVGDDDLGDVYYVGYYDTTWDNWQEMSIGSRTTGWHHAEFVAANDYQVEVYFDGSLEATVGVSSATNAFINKCWVVDDADEATSNGTAPDVYFDEFLWSGSGVVNGDFAAGNLNGWTQFLIDPLGDGQNTIYRTSVLGLAPPLDGHGAGTDLGHPQTGWYSGIYQVISGVTPGAALSLSVDCQILCNDTSGPPFEHDNGNDFVYLFWVDGTSTDFTSSFPGSAEVAGSVVSPLTDWTTVSANIIPSGTEVIIGTAAYFYSDNPGLWVTNNHIVDNYSLTQILTNVDGESWRRYR